MTGQPLECTYWFKGYQIDNTDKNILANDFKLRYSDYNAQVLTRLLMGDQSGAGDLETNVSAVKKLIQGYKDPDNTAATPQDGLYEIITFKQRTNNGTTTADQDSRCIYSIILKKKKAEKLDANNSSANLDAMWLAIFCPRTVCSEIGCGPFHIWKVNFEGIPNVRLQWYSDVNYTSSNPTPKYCIVSDFKGSGEKPLFGVMGRQGSNDAKFYLSPLSFYLEGRHEDILKKVPKPMDKTVPTRLDGFNIYYLQFNNAELDKQPN